MNPFLTFQNTNRLLKSAQCPEVSAEFDLIDKK